MDIAITADIYCPTIDEDKYTDHFPYIAKGAGMKCPCNGCTRTYTSKSRFRIHTESLCHKKWIADLNANRENHYKRLIEAENNVKTQRLIIAQLTNKVAELSLELATRSAQNSQHSIDLISFE